MKHLILLFLFASNAFAIQCTCSDGKEYEIKEVVPPIEEPKVEEKNKDVEEAVNKLQEAVKKKLQRGSQSQTESGS